MAEPKQKGGMAGRQGTKQHRSLRSMVEQDRAAKLREERPKGEKPREEKPREERPKGGKFRGEQPKEAVRRGAKAVQDKQGAKPRSASQDSKRWSEPVQSAGSRSATAG